MGEATEHVSVLVREVCRALTPVFSRTGAGVLVDATVGLGGHVLALLESIAQAACAPPRLVVGFDRDPDALAIARSRLGAVLGARALVLIDGPFSGLAAQLDEVLAAHAGDGAEVVAVLADLGVSSLQLDRGARGFSWRVDAPLDMRMDPRRGRSAADVLGDIDGGALTRILRELGEEPEAPRIAAAIVRARPRTTFALAEVVAAAMSAPARRKLGARVHPATRTFQALRIHVNDELGELDALLAAAPDRLARGGRLGIISFHSLEDRRVKQRFATLSSPPPMPAHVPLREHERPRPAFAIPPEFRGGVTAADDELAHNPRARSARLRVLERV
ncbi:MAG: 16S rRNA (cytosine(1402)-N(4))-methyltransferase RsmH [Nannocystaceae bacterium]|nr:16S rRNA (cytosine(1402)-N(4))-methyltransferase RsmH [Nannocystaceae bacterium]